MGDSKAICRYVKQLPCAKHNYSIYKEYNGFMLSIRKKKYSERKNEKNALAWFTVFAIFRYLNICLTSLSHALFLFVPAN